MSQCNKKTVNRDFKGIWIPKEIWLFEGISNQEILLWAEIDSLYCKEKNGCFASNEYLRTFIGVKERRLQEMIHNLKEKGLLIQTGFNGRQRYLKAINPKECTSEVRKSAPLENRGAEKCTPQMQKTAPLVLKPHILIENKEDNKDIAQSAKPLRKSDPFFSFDSKKFEGISEEELKKWQLLYPSVDISKELLRMEDWCLSNPSKAKSKKLWRKFISGWLARNNEEITNKQAYKSRNSVDRRTKDKDGNPIKHVAEDLF